MELHPRVQLEPPFHTGVFVGGVVVDDHVESVRVTETWQGETVWDGTVEVFDLLDHPTAERAYAWAHETDEGGTRYVAVLHETPIDSPQAAVRAAIVSEHRGP